MWDNFKQPNIWVAEVLKGGDRKKKKLFKEMIVQNFPNLMKTIYKLK